MTFRGHLAGYFFQFTKVKQNFELYKKEGKNLEF